MTRYRILDLFCGLGGFSQAFEESDRWDVTTVDIEERFEPDICVDVFDLRPSDFDESFDVVLASPPCTEFSFAASRYERIVEGEPQTDDAADSVALVYHTIGLIKGLSPTYWALENPQGWLRHIIGEPTGRVTYCQYGETWMKPTDLWGKHPPGLSYLACSYGDGCHNNNNTDQAHGGLGNCLASGTRDPAERAKVPYDLSDAIRDACERALDGEAPEQRTLDEVVA
jgi:hypothetical protein